VNQRARAPKKMVLEQFLFLAWWVVKNSLLSRRGQAAAG
jgi:hypothetical protein